MNLKFTNIIFFQASFNGSMSKTLMFHWKGLSSDLIVVKSFFKNELKGIWLELIPNSMNISNLIVMDRLKATQSMKLNVMFINYDAIVCYEYVCLFWYSTFIYD